MRSLKVISAYVLKTVLCCEWSRKVYSVILFKTITKPSKNYQLGIMMRVSNSLFSDTSYFKANVNSEWN